jgi:hypothetical protein
MKRRTWLLTMGFAALSLTTSTGCWCYRPFGWRLGLHPAPIVAPAPAPLLGEPVGPAFGAQPGCTNCGGTPLLGSPLSAAPGTGMPMAGAMPAGLPVAQGPIYQGPIYQGPVTANPPFTGYPVQGTAVATQPTLGTPVASKDLPAPGVMPTSNTK